MDTPALPGPVRRNRLTLLLEIGAYIAALAAAAWEVIEESVRDDGDETKAIALGVLQKSVNTLSTQLAAVDEASADSSITLSVLLSEYARVTQPLMAELASSPTMPGPVASVFQRQIASAEAMTPSARGYFSVRLLAEDSLEAEVFGSLQMDRDVTVSAIVAVSLASAMVSAAIEMEGADYQEIRGAALAGLTTVLRSAAKVDQERDASYATVIRHLERLSSTSPQTSPTTTVSLASEGVTAGRMASRDIASRLVAFVGSERRASSFVRLLSKAVRLHELGQWHE